MERAPAGLRPYLQLARYDRPAGFWLLGLPCAIGLMLSRLQQGGGLDWTDALLLLLFAIGSIAMRGAGCTWNDILDRDIDAKVARTALRPLPSGAVTLKQAMIWLLLQCLAGLGVLLSLFAWSPLAVWIALGSIPLVAAYPLMKRITWWPQVWLGLTFNWGTLVAAACSGAVTTPDLVLYAALVLWTLGYDTIYALQDREDDAMIGVKSTARRFGGHVKPAVAVIYLICAAAAATAGGLAHGWIAALAIAPFAAHLAQQALRLMPDSTAISLQLFRSNREAGLLLAVSWAFLAASA